MQALLAAIDAADWDKLHGMLHERSRYEVPGQPPFEGRDAVMHYYRALRPIASGRHDVESIVVDGDRAVCCGRFRGERRDGSRIDLSFADVVLFAAGLILTRRVYFHEPAR
jgi:ketosteroid isomerase-like protein